MSRAYMTVANDYGKPLVVAFRYSNAAAGSLSDVVPPGTTVVAVIVNADTGVALVDRKPATIVASTGGVVTIRYDWDTPELDTAGEYDTTFEAAATGGPVTLPTAGSIPTLIDLDLG